MEMNEVMSLSELSTIVASVMISLGGGGGIVLLIGKMFADRHLERAKHEIQQEVESYRTKLKKSEFLFQKEFEATSQFISLHHSFLPRYLHPDMDWHEACTEFARNFSQVEKKLEQYRATHGAVLQQDALDHLPREWREKLEKIYRTTEMSQIEIFPFYNSWNPPSDWIEDTERLDTPTLREFLVFLNGERLNRDRYSFEKFAGDDWRIKISSYDKIVPFHEEVEKFLIEKAKEKGCRSSPIVVTLTPAKEDKKSIFFKLSFPTPKDTFNFDKEIFGRKE